MNNNRHTGLGVIIAIIAVVGILGMQQAHAAKVTKTSWYDGWNKGASDASRDLVGANGHGYDPSCPSGHTSVYCDGYTQGYNEVWFGVRGGGGGSSSSSSSASSGGGIAASSSAAAGGGSSSSSSSSSSDFLSHNSINININEG